MWRNFHKRDAARRVEVSRHVQNAKNVLLRARALPHVTERSSVCRDWFRALRKGGREISRRCMLAHNKKESSFCIKKYQKQTEFCVAGGGRCCKRCSHRVRHAFFCNRCSMGPTPPFSFNQGHGKRSHYRTYIYQIRSYNKPMTQLPRRAYPLLSPRAVKSYNVMCTGTTSRYGFFSLLSRFSNLEQDRRG